MDTAQSKVGPFGLGEGDPYSDGYAFENGKGYGHGEGKGEGYIFGSGYGDHPQTICTEDGIQGYG